MNIKCQLAMALLAMAGFASVRAAPMVYSVDCSNGESISAAMARGDARKPLVLNISGICVEAVSIDRDDVTLQGAPRATIAPPDGTLRAVNVSGSDITLAGLDVVGGNLGIALNGTARTIVTDCTVQDTRGDGIRMFAGDARIQNTRVERAGGNGISLQRRSSLALSNASAVLDSHLSGIAVNQFSFASVSGSTFSGNGGSGVEVIAGGSAGIDNNSITGNAKNGVFGYLGPTIVMHGNQVHGNGEAGLACRSRCTLQVGGGADIRDNGSDGIVLLLGSVLIIEETGAVSENNNYWGLWCGDAQSRVDGLAYFTGMVSEQCLSFGN